MGFFWKEGLLVIEEIGSRERPADVAELVDALSSGGSVTSTWGFESPGPHKRKEARSTKSDGLLWIPELKVASGTASGRRPKSLLYGVGIQPTDDGRLIA